MLLRASLSVCSQDTAWTKSRARFEDEKCLPRDANAKAGNWGNLIVHLIASTGCPPPGEALTLVSVAGSRHQNMCIFQNFCMNFLCILLIHFLPQLISFISMSL
jgi:hypothetical protein